MDVLQSGRPDELGPTGEDAPASARLRGHGARRVVVLLAFALGAGTGGFAGARVAGSVVGRERDSRAAAAAADVVRLGATGAIGTPPADLAPDSPTSLRWTVSVDNRGESPVTVEQVDLLAVDGFALSGSPDAATTTRVQPGELVSVDFDLRAQCGALTAGPVSVRVLARPEGGRSRPVDLVARGDDQALYQAAQEGCAAVESAVLGVDASFTSFRRTGSRSAAVDLLLYPNASENATVRVTRISIAGGGVRLSVSPQLPVLLSPDGTKVRVGLVVEDCARALDAAGAALRFVTSPRATAEIEEPPDPGFVRDETRFVVASCQR